MPGGAPKSHPQTSTDILIVGAGLAGLHCALRLSAKYPKLRITVAEVYNYVGGRVVSYSPPGYNTHWEIGAGRIHKSHHLTLEYIKHYGLTLAPIPAHQEWRATGSAQSQPNVWPSLATILTHSLSHLSPATLASHTVQDLFETLYGKQEARRLLLHFPYRAELTRMRADLALKSFGADSEMGTYDDFFVVREGLSKLSAAMRKEAESRGVRFLLGHRLTSISIDTHPLTLNFQVKADASTPAPKSRLVSLTCGKAILALHATALRGISPFGNYPVLKHITMAPLLRTYGIFPTSHGRSWFSDLPHTVTDSPIRYVIPINPSRGVIMTSYTDDQDTKHWMRIFDRDGPRGLEKAIVHELRELMPERKIPNPMFFKAHPWTEGCSYWTPGMYSPEEMSDKILYPMPARLPNVFVCGESYCVGYQCWIEGALCHASKLLREHFDC